MLERKRGGFKCTLQTIEENEEKKEANVCSTPSFQKLKGVIKVTNYKFSNGGTYTGFIKRGISW